MPTLLQINVEANRGSVGRIAEQIGQIVIRKGWKSYIAYARNEASSESELIKIGSRIDICWHGVKTRLWDKHGLGSGRATKKLIKTIENIRPDIIQLHNIHGYYLNMEILFTYLATLEIPIVWVLHDCWPITGHCTYFDFTGCSKWKTGCHHCPLKREYPGSYFLDRSSENYRLKKYLFTGIKNMTIVTVSNWLKHIVEQSFLREYPIQTIFNGVDINVFRPDTEIACVRSKYDLDNKFLILGVAGVWANRKGLEDFKKLRDKLAKDIVILLVGLSKKQIRELPEGIIGLTRTECVEELAKLYNLADVHVSFSVEETFGLTIAESMSCGTPVIVYNSTACPELVTPDTGYVIEKDRIEEAVAAIGEIRMKGKNFFSLPCRQRVEEFYNKEECYNNYYVLYNRLLTTR